MAKDYGKFQTKITECMDILATAQTLDTSDKENSQWNLISSGFAGLMNMVDKQNQLIKAMYPLITVRARGHDEPQDDYDQSIVDKDEAKVAFDAAEIRTRAIVKEVCYSLQLQQAVSQGDDITGRKLICSFYDYKDTVTYHRQRCKDADLKNLRMFTGKESDVDWACETLLTNLSTTAAQLELSERGLCLALLSKLTDIGLQIVKGRMDSLGLTSETIEFHQLQAIVEESFMKNSDSKSALRALYSLKQLQPGNTAYQQLEGQILRLCRLSLQHVNDPKEKQILFQSRAREVFLRCLTSEDRQKISLKEIERSQQNESQWQLHQIVSYLTDVSKVSIEANTSGPSPYQDSSIRQVYDQETGEQDYDEEYQEINAVQRGSQQKFRGRFLRQRGNQVGGQRGRGRSYTPRKW